MNVEEIVAVLNQVDLPFLGQGWANKKCLRKVELLNNTLSIDVQLGFPVSPVAEAIRSSLSQAAKGTPGIDNVVINLSDKIAPHGASANKQPIPNVKNIIAIGSGKGGVGKSTTAVNVACSLQQAGARVGLVDADIYGPNQPHMLGSSEKPELIDETLMKPVIRHGLQTISMGNLVDPASPMVWRGPMVVKAFQQFLYQTAWEDLDYLIIDLPPGTGDIQLTLSQKVPLAGAVIVTTPQDVALLDVRKGIEMFRKVNVPILGVVENMSVYHCPHCQKASHPFGQAGGERIAEKYAAVLLGALPLDVHVREQADRGVPIVLSGDHQAVVALYQNIALQIAANLSLQQTNLASQIGVAVEGKK